MFGLIGTIMYGLVYSSAWSDANNIEQKQRKSSSKNGIRFYFDKNGRMRNPLTGKKYTPEEVHKIMNPVSVADQMKDYDYCVHEYLKAVFYTVLVKNEGRHFFLTERKALDFIEEYNKTVDSENHFDTARLVNTKESGSGIDALKNTHKECVCHFDYEKYIGRYAKRIKRR